jgi:N-acetylmuramic acid 6-phosphate etherase
MSVQSNQRSEEFLKISGQFQLGGLTTEASHPLTATLSETAETSVERALEMLFKVDEDVLRRYRSFVESKQAGAIAQAVVDALENGGRMFFTGCGSTGRLSIQLVSIWRDFWQQQAGRGGIANYRGPNLEHRAFAAMAGGDYALIKAVEGFEDFAAFGKKQLGDLGVGPKDVVFAITEGGETSFVIGTAWKGVEVGAKVYFIYNNPDEVLCQTVQRSREVIEEPRIEKLNLTTGPMAITGSTRMQATTIQLCVLLTILEMVLRELRERSEAPSSVGLKASAVPEQFLGALERLQGTLNGSEVIDALAGLVSLEETTYRSGHKNNYFADRFAIDVLTDTTERSPTYCTPPFRKFDDSTATESWAFLFTAPQDTASAWKQIIKREPACVEWTEAEIRELVTNDKVATTQETVRKISARELMRFKVGLDGLPYRPLTSGDMAVAVVSELDKDALFKPEGFYRAQLEAAKARGASIGLVFFGAVDAIEELKGFLKEWSVDCRSVLVEVPRTDFLLDGITRVAVKTVLNTLSTCAMVRLGRVMGNYMIWVVPSNLKLIDRPTRYIQRLTKLSYLESNQLLFEVIEYVAPRMKADQAYPPVVGTAVMRAREGISNEEAEQRLFAKLAVKGRPGPA